MSTLSRLFLLFLSFSLIGCTGLGDDNTPAPTPLTSYPLQIQPVLAWSTVAGGGTGKDFLRLNPVVKNDKIFVTNKSGLVTAVSLTKGRKLWQTNVKHPISNGPAVGEGVVIFSSMQPQLLALQAKNGKLMWQVPLPNQVLSPPSIRAGRVVIKTVDGKVMAFALKTGQRVWVYEHGAPRLVMRVSSAPSIVADKVVVGFSDGVLAALHLNDGKLLWERDLVHRQGITQTDQLVDIAASPTLTAKTVYVATYQGKLSAVSLQTGRIQWQRPFSTYSSLALGKNLYAVDSEDELWAFNHLTGDIIWHTRLLKNRGLTAPTVIGNNLVLGDKQGYLHWFSQITGQPLARILVQKDVTISTVSAVTDPMVCVLTNQGGLSVWSTSTLHS